MNTTQSLRTLFMGTPEFAVPSLRGLHDETTNPKSKIQNLKLITVATQPDRPAGRGNKLTVTPVKQFALDHNIPVLQPASLRKDPAAVEAIRQLAPDLIVVAAYGLILPKSVLSIPRYGCINVHGSLLPAYRGASPIATAILHGEAETGISIMLMDEGMDTGSVLAMRSTPITAKETTQSLTERLATIGADLLVETLPGWVADELRPTPQSELSGQVSICRTIDKEAGQIDWSQPAAQIERMTRAYNPWPSAFTTWKGTLLKIWEADVVDGSATPGLVIARNKGAAIGSGQGLLQLNVVQPAGKKPMDIRSFLNGAQGFVGSSLVES